MGANHSNLFCLRNTYINSSRDFAIKSLKNHVVKLYDTSNINSENLSSFLNELHIFRLSGNNYKRVQYQYEVCMGELNMSHYNDRRLLNSLKEYMYSDDTDDHIVEIEDRMKSGECTEL